MAVSKDSTPSHDMLGKVVVVTGGDMGIGLATAMALAARGATTIITVRPPASGLEAVQLIAAATGNTDVHSVPLELGSLASVRAAATEILSRWQRLDVLVNNAGALFSDRKETAEGHEMSFGVNYLGPYLLTRLLFARAAASAPARIVNVSSNQHTMAGEFDFNDLEARMSFDGMKAYGRAKLGVILFTKELARRGKSLGISAFIVQPGVARTRIDRHGETHGKEALILWLLRPIMLTPEKGASASIFCATEPGIEARSGACFQRKVQGLYGPVREFQPSRHALDDHAGALLWKISAELVGLAS